MCLISWERTQKRDPHKLFRGDFGGQNGVPNGSFSATQCLVCCFFPVLNSGPKKTMTATDVTGFYALFSARKSGNFLYILGLFLKLHSKPREKGKNPLEKIQKNPVETAPRNCRFLSLVVVERVLINNDVPIPCGPVALHS